MKQIKGLISLSKRAGMLVVGMDCVAQEILADPQGLVVLAEDLSENSKKKIINICEASKVNCIQLSMKKDDVHQLIQKYAGVLYIKDPGFGNKIYDLYRNKGGNELDGCNL